MNIMLCAFLYLRSRTYVVENTNLIHQNGTFTSILDEKEYCRLGQIIDAKLKSL